MQPPQPPHGGRPPVYGPGAPPPGPPGPPGWGPPPPGSRPPNNGGIVVLIVAVVAFAVLVGGGGVLWLLSDSDDDSPDTLEVAAPTFSDLPTPTRTLPTPAPTLPKRTYSPPPRNYGAIAVGRSGAVGKSWDHDSPSTARRRALNECSGSCKVLTTFVNGCGAVAYNRGTNRYWGGRGDTRSAAQRDAISNAGGGRVVVWVCTTR
ncbi:DUF4189 domain-containing protein [Actinomadura welshii]